jgi:hypothetical protein
MSAGTQHPSELGQHGRQFGDVGERERADDRVDRVVGQRKPVQIGREEPDVRQSLAGPREHLR